MAAWTGGHCLSDFKNYHLLSHLEISQYMLVWEKDYFCFNVPYPQNYITHLPEEKFQKEISFRIHQGYKIPDKYVKSTQIILKEMLLLAIQSSAEDTRRYIHTVNLKTSNEKRQLTFWRINGNVFITAEVYIHTAHNIYSRLQYVQSQSQIFHC